MVYRLTLNVPRDSDAQIKYCSVTTNLLIRQEKCVRVYACVCKCSGLESVMVMWWVALPSTSKSVSASRQKKEMSKGQDVSFSRGRTGFKSWQLHKCYCACLIRAKCECSFWCWSWRHDEGVWSQKRNTLKDTLILSHFLSLSSFFCLSWISVSFYLTCCPHLHFSNISSFFLLPLTPHPPPLLFPTPPSLWGPVSID